MINNLILSKLDNYKNILIFSDRFPYLCGGADLYLEEILFYAKEKNIKLFIVKKNHLNFIKKFKKSKIKFDKELYLKNIQFPWQLKYLEFLLLKKNIKDFFSKNHFNLDQTLLLAQDMIGFHAVNRFKGKSIYLIQELMAFNNFDKNLNENNKLHSLFLTKLDLFFFYKNFRHSALIAIKKSLAISNSKFTSSFIKNKFNIDTLVSYPLIKKNLKAKYEGVKNEIPMSKKGIVMVGDSYLKGYQSTLYIAEKLPEYKFYIFGRSVKSLTKKTNNVFLMPWENDSIDIYKYANIVIVPSILQETYGMVAREASILGIKCLVRDIGGLPEAIDNSNFICNTDDDFINKIKKI